MSGAGEGVGGGLKKLSATDKRMQAAAAGKLMLESHYSYTQHAGLGSAETDLLVELVTQRGAEAGFCGGRVAGAGSGGTVAILGEDSGGAAVRGELEAIAGEYQ